MLLTRLKALMATFLFLSIGGCAFYYSYREIIEYFEWRDVVLFSWMVPFAFIASFIMFAVATAPGHVVIYAKLMGSAHLKILLKTLFIFLFFSIVGAAFFSMAYSNLLESKGYSACKGIPSGWTPGTAVKYVVDSALCNKK